MRRNGLCGVIAGAAGIMALDITTYGNMLPRGYATGLGIGGLYGLLRGDRGSAGWSFPR